MEIFNLSWDLMIAWACGTWNGLVNSANPEFFAMSIGTVPLVGMAMQEDLNVEDLQRLKEFSQGNGRPIPHAHKKRGKPWSSYFVFIPCLIAELPLGMLHGAVYNEIVQFGKDVFPATIPILGDIAIFFGLKQVSVGVLIILAMTSLVLIAPIMTSVMLHRLGVMKKGIDVIQYDPIAKVKLGTPLAMYVGALAVEVYALYERIQLQKVKGPWDNPDMVVGDPNMMIMVAVLTLSLTTLVGYWTGTKIHKFQQDA